MAAHHPSTVAACTSMSCDDLGQEAQLADRTPRCVPCAIGIEQRRDALLSSLARLGAHFVDDRFERARASPPLGGVRSSLSPLELPLEEIERQRGVGFVERVDAVERQEILRAGHRIACSVR